MNTNGRTNDGDKYANPSGSSSALSLSFYDRQVEAAAALHDHGIDLCYGHHRHDQAVTSLRQAARLRESLLGKFHADTALTYFRIASILGRPSDGVGIKREQSDQNLLEALMVARRELRITYGLLGVVGGGGGGSDDSQDQATASPLLIMEGMDLNGVMLGGDENAPFISSSSSDLSSTTSLSPPSRPLWLQERLSWIQDRALLLFQRGSGPNINVLDSSQERTPLERAQQYVSQLLMSMELERLGDQHLRQQKLEVALTHYNNALAVESNAYRGTCNLIDMTDLHVKAANTLVELHKQTSLQQQQQPKEHQKEQRQPGGGAARARRSAAGTRTKDDLYYYESALEELKNAERKYRQVFVEDDNVKGNEESFLWDYQVLPARDTHASIGHILAKMASIYLVQHRFDDALATYAKVYSIMESCFGKGHAQCVEALSDIRLVTVREMEHLRKAEWRRTVKMPQSPRRSKKMEQLVV